VKFDFKTKNPSVFDLDFINSVLIAPKLHPEAIIDLDLSIILTCPHYLYHSLYPFNRNTFSYFPVHKKTVYDFDT